MKLIVKQSNIQEQVSSELIDKLYQVASGGALTNDSDLQGSLVTQVTYEDAVNYLREHFPNLIITADAYYIRFADEKVLEALLNDGVGDGVGVSTANAIIANITNTFKNNTQITSFEEFPYFTSQQARSTNFTGCTSLARIDISSCSVISNGMLSGCIMLEYFNGPGSDRGVLTVPNGVTMIDNNAFRHLDKVTKIVFSDTVTEVRMNSCDWNAALDEVVFGTGITTVGRDAFEYDTALTKVRVPSIETWLNITFANYAACNPLAYAGHLYVNDTEVTALTIPDGTTTIGTYQFIGGVGFQTISIPQSVVSIGRGAFQRCSGAVINEVNLPNLASLAADAFNGTKIQVISDLGHITELKWGTFQSCTSLTTVTLPNGLTTIEGNTFYGCSSLSIVNLPSSVTTIGADGFGTASITTVNITDLDAWTNIDFNNAGSTPIKDSTQLLLNGNPVTTYTFPNDRAAIKKYCFYKVKSLTSITIPNTVTSIEINAFYACSSLATITLNEGLTSIGNSSFQDTAIESITLPSTLTSLGNAFVGCKQLQSIAIPNGCALLSERTFQACEKMTSVTLPNDLTSIPKYTFYMCYKLNNVVIPSSVTSIGQEAFRDCSSLTSITIQGTLTSIGSRAFSECKFTTAPNLGNITTLPFECFGACKQMTSITIPNTVTTIENNVFLNCHSLNNVVVPSSVTTIGKNVWYNCSSMISLTFESTTPPTIESPMIYSPNAGLVIYVPAGNDPVTGKSYVDIYKETSGWSTYADRIQAIQT